MSRESSQILQSEKDYRLIETNERLLNLNDEESFLGVTIHDLKSPLNRVIGLIDLVYQQGTDKINEATRVVS
jgi:signal transduction histidine kinase